MDPNHRSTTPDDDDLARAAQAGDDDALAQLLQRFYPRLWSVCRRMAADPDAADDLAQDAMLKIIRGLPTFSGDSKFSTWAIRVTMNVCLTQRRRDKVRRTASLDATTTTTADQRLTSDAPDSSFGKQSGQQQPAEPDAAARVQLSEDLARVERALAQLDPAQRTVLVLRDMQGLDYAQIAAALDIAVGTVKSRISRARTALRNAIDPPTDPESSTPAAPTE